MPTPPASVFKCLSDETRLRTLLLIQHEGELCVCEIAAALDLAQPKISRHLAQLRTANLLLDSRQGQWIYYRLHPELARWITELLEITGRADPAPLEADRARLRRMGNRPERRAACC